MRSVAVFLGVALVCVLGACAMPPPLAEKAQRVKVGMSEAEVEAIMGVPRIASSVASVRDALWVRDDDFGKPAETAYGRYESGVLVAPLETRLKGR